MNIPPTVGRVVWYYPPGRSTNSEPLAAIIACVRSGSVVNLAIFMPDGTPMINPPTSIPLLQEGETTPPMGQGFCTWMPYQRSKAKTEADAFLANADA